MKWLLVGIDFVRRRPLWSLLLLLLLLLLPSIQMLCNWALVMWSVATRFGTAVGIPRAIIDRVGMAFVWLAGWAARHATIFGVAVGVLLSWLSPLLGFWWTVFTLVNPLKPNGVELRVYQDDDAAPAFPESPDPATPSPTTPLNWLQAQLFR